LIVPSADPDTIFVPSGEKVTELILSLWALVFSATQLMSIAIIQGADSMYSVCEGGAV